MLRLEEDLARQASASHTSVHPRPRATVEDCADEGNEPISWYETVLPASDRDSIFGETVDGAGAEGSLPPEMLRALSGAVPFSSGEEFRPPGASDVTLEDVLGGAGLFRKVMGLDEESPLCDSSGGWLAAGSRLDEEVAPSKCILGCI